MADKLSRSVLFKVFRKVLISKFGETCASKIWQDANINLISLEQWKPELDSDSRMMILPAAALYSALQKFAPEKALPLLTDYGTQIGKKIARIIHAVTSIPGIPRLLWKHMPALM